MNKTEAARIAAIKKLPDAELFVQFEDGAYNAWLLDRLRAKDRVIEAAKECLNECERVLRLNATAWKMGQAAKAEICRRHAENARKMIGSIDHAAALAEETK